MARPKKIQWPIGFEEMLLFAFAKKRPEDRLKFYRLFLRDYLHPGTTIQASPEEIETALLADRRKKFSENWAFHIRMWSNGSFEKWKRENYQKRAKAMAAGRWSKDKNKQNAKTQKN
jgi:hypothetical protein